VIGRYLLRYLKYHFTATTINKNLSFRCTGVSVSCKQVHKTRSSARTESACSVSVVRLHLRLLESLDFGLNLVSLIRWINWRLTNSLIHLSRSFTGVWTDLHFANREGKFGVAVTIVRLWIVRITRLQMTGGCWAPILPPL